MKYEIGDFVSKSVTGICKIENILYLNPQDEKNDKLETNKRIFNTDLQGIKNSDILIFFLDGRVPDEGACVELGIAYALGKKCIGYKTDDRNLDFTGDDNLFIEGCMDFKVMHNIIELKNELEKS